MKKLKFSFLILLSILLIFTSCNKEKVITEEKEPILQRVTVDYTATEYKLPIMEGYRDFKILKADKNKLYILVDYLDDEVEAEPWKEYAHENLIVYNFQNEEILKDIELEEYMEIKDIAIDTGEIYIIYKDLSTFNNNNEGDSLEVENEEDSLEIENDGDVVTLEEKDNNLEEITEIEEDSTDAFINVDSTSVVEEDSLDKEKSKNKTIVAKFDEDNNIEVLDTIYSNNIIPKFATVNDRLFYSCEESDSYRIKVIINGRPQNFYKFKDELIGNIYSNNRSLFALVKRGDSAYYYSISIDGGVKEFYIEVREELSDYEFLKGGIISSYLDINDNELPKLMYINLNNSKKKIFDNNVIATFISNNGNNCLMVDTASNLEYLYVKDDELFTSEVEEYSGNNFKFYENENKRYGITDLNRKYIYIDIYFE